MFATDTYMAESHRYSCMEDATQSLGHAIRAARARPFPTTMCATRRSGHSHRLRQSERSTVFCFPGRVRDMEQGVVQKIEPCPSPKRLHDWIPRRLTNEKRESGTRIAGTKVLPLHIARKNEVEIPSCQVALMRSRFEGQKFAPRPFPFWLASNSVVVSGPDKLER